VTTLHELLAEADRIALARLDFEPLVAPLRQQADALKAQLAIIEAEISTKLKGRHSLDEEFEAVGRKIENHGVDRDTLEQLVETRMQLLTGAGIVVIPASPAPAPAPSTAASAAPEAGVAAQEEDKQNPARQRRTRSTPVVTADTSAVAPAPAKEETPAPDAAAPAGNQPASAEEEAAGAVTHYMAIEPEKISLSPQAFQGEHAAEPSPEDAAGEGAEDATVDGEEVMSLPEAEPANDDALAVLTAREQEPINIPETLRSDAPAAPEGDPEMPAFLMSAEPAISAPPVPAAAMPQDEFVPPFLAHS
jgi:hypothetical protein